ncbi:MAG: hypothetical protein ABTQ34_03890 [Bdellovibrionales bacterium]
MTAENFDPLPNILRFPRHESGNLHIAVNDTDRLSSRNLISKPRPVAGKFICGVS